MKPHPSTDQLLDRLYGVGSLETASHLEGCADCARRYREFEQRRAEAAASSEPSNNLLAAQRRAIYARLDQSAGSGLHWAPAAVAILIFALGLFMYRPPSHRSTPAARPEVTDEQLFSDVYSMEESAEPRAGAPIHELFEDAVFEEGAQ